MPKTNVQEQQPADRSLQLLARTVKEHCLSLVSLFVGIVSLLVGVGVVVVLTVPQGKLLSKLVRILDGLDNRTTVADVRSYLISARAQEFLKQWASRAAGQHFVNLSTAAQAEMVFQLSEKGRELLCQLQGDLLYEVLQRRHFRREDSIADILLAQDLDKLQSDIRKYNEQRGLGSLSMKIVLGMLYAALQREQTDC
jgi:hypothetical protein